MCFVHLARALTKNDNRKNNVFLAENQGNLTNNNSIKFRFSGRQNHRRSLYYFVVFHMKSKLANKLNSRPHLIYVETA